MFSMAEIKHNPAMKDPRLAKPFDAIKGAKIQYANKGQEEPKKESKEEHEMTGAKQVRKYVEYKEYYKTVVQEQLIVKCRKNRLRHE